MTTKTAEDLAEIQNLTIPELGDALVHLDAQDLAALKALEQGSGKPRSKALDAIDAAAARLPPAQAQASQADDIAHDDAAADAPPAAIDAGWQLPDYTGPLDIEKAEWRRVNLKPVRGVATK